MKQIFHYHMTVEKCTSSQLKEVSRAVSPKPTTIDLYNQANKQKDRMITKYGTNADDLKTTMLDDMLAIHNLGFNIVRMKIEQNMEELTFSSSAKLTEVHIKVPNTFINTTSLKLSENAVENTKFLNGRAYNLKDLITLEAELQQIDGLAEPQYEIVWFDTNPSHDLWWA